MTDGAYDDAYDNTNRAFLQAFFARSALTFEEAKPLLAAIETVHKKRECLAEDVTEADFRNYIAAANQAISPFDYEIRDTLHQTSRRRVYCLINSTSDALTQLATIHTPDEIGFLKRILDAMFETYNTPGREIMAITSLQAMKLAKVSSASRRETENGSETQGSAGQGVTMVQAEKMLKSLVDEGWFEKSRKGYYSLSVRALMELRGWLLETYNEPDDDDNEESTPERIKMCMGCKEIITMGQKCPQRHCSGRLHDICVQQFFRTQDHRKCPLCKTDWTGNDFVGERAAAGPKEKAPRNSNLRHRASMSTRENDQDAEQSALHEADDVNDRSGDDDDDDD